MAAHITNRSDPRREKYDVHFPVLDSGAHMYDLQVRTGSMVRAWAGAYP